MLNSQQAKELHKALVEAFPTRTALAQMVSFGLGENLAAIVGDGSLANIVFDLIAWARSKDQVLLLVKAALEANPSNPILRDFATNFGVHPDPSIRTQIENPYGRPLEQPLGLAVYSSTQSLQYYGYKFRPISDFLDNRPMIEELQIQYAHTLEERKTLAIRVQTLETELHQKEIAITQHKSDLNIAIRTNTDLKKQMRGLQSQVDSLKTTLATQDTNLANCKTNLEVAESKLQAALIPKIISVIAVAAMGVGTNIITQTPTSLPGWILFGLALIFTVLLIFGDEITNSQAGKR
jgi:hypothetical protein